IVAAEILRKDGTLLAKDPNASVAHTALETLIHVDATVVLGDRIGTVNLWASTAELHAALLKHSGILLTVILGALGLALVVASRLQRFISEPIQALSRAAARVSRDKDYSLR